MRRVIVDQCDHPADQLAGPVVLARARQYRELGQQRRAQAHPDTVGDDAARHHHHLRTDALEQDLIVTVILTGHDEQGRIQLQGGHDDREVVRVVVGAGHQADGLDDPGLLQRDRLGTTPVHDAFLGDAGLVRNRLDHGELQALIAQMAIHGLAETPETADHPTPFGRRKDRCIERLVLVAGQPLAQQGQTGRLNGDRHIQGEGIERVVDVIGSERGHVGLDLMRIGPTDDRDLGMQELRSDGDLEIGLVDVGECDHAFAERMFQACGLETGRLAGIGAQGGDIFAQVIELEQIDTLRIDVDRHHTLMSIGQAAHQGGTGLAVAADEIEGFAQSPDPAAKTRLRDGTLKGGVLQQRDQGTDRVEPDRDRREHAEGDPDSLCIRKGVRQFAETDGGRHVADEIEGMEEARRNRVAGRVLRGNQHHTRHRHRVGPDQDQERRAHPPHDEVDDVVHN